MPPRAKRSKTAVAVVTSTPEAPDAPYQYSPATFVPKIACLPVELYDEIISYLEVLPICIDYKAGGGLSALSAPNYNFQERNTTLRALGATCRATRAVFHPKLWERLDCVFVPQRKWGTWFKYTVVNAINKLQAVRAEPALRAFIRIITLTIPSTTETPALMTELARTLPLLPSLHTIQILSCNKPGPAGEALSKCNISTVRTVSVDPDAHAIVRACPNATRVFSTIGSSTALLNAMKMTPNLIHFRGMFDWYPKTALASARALVKSAPNLRSLELRESLYVQQWPELFSVFSGLHKLDTLYIGILMPYQSGYGPLRAKTPTLEDLEADERAIAFIQAAKKLMASRRAVPHDVKRKLFARHCGRGRDRVAELVDPTVYETVYVFE